MPKESSGHFSFVDIVDSTGWSCSSSEPIVCTLDSGVILSTEQKRIRIRYRANYRNHNRDVTNLTQANVEYSDGSVLDKNSSRTLTIKKAIAGIKITKDAPDSVYENKPIKVKGKSWFDRQWGPYRLIESATHWEWFSLRFFDDEEIMLFAFPQHPYYDGTYIDKNRKQYRLRNYRYTPKEYVEVNGFSFTQGWDLELPGIKDERYRIRPILDGQMNLAYFELLAEIINPDGERVGYCFVELLPGVRNPEKSIGFRNLFKQV